MRFFKRKVKIIANPWLTIEHEHDWLEANNGLELVCGLCAIRKENDGKKTKSGSGPRS
jgi:hypothetical protein